MRFNGRLVGFSVSGHAGAGPFGRDIVCAAVSSAVMLTANTITEYLYCKADVKDTGNKIMFVLKDPGSTLAMSAIQVIESFKNHLDTLSEDSKGKIKVNVREMSRK